jgi:uncharacterized protein (TIGR02118 family)
VTEIIVLVSAAEAAWSPQRRDALVASLRDRWLPGGTAVAALRGLVYSDVLRHFDETSRVRGGFQLWIDGPADSFDATLLTEGVLGDDLTLDVWVVREWVIKEPVERQAAKYPADVVKLMGSAFRRPDFTVDAFFRYWMDIHSYIGAKVPGVGGYVVSQVLAPEPRNGLTDAYIEQWITSEEIFDASGDAPEAAAAWADVPNYALTTGVFWLMKETVLFTPPATGPGLHER